MINEESLDRRRPGALELIETRPAFQKTSRDVGPDFVEPVRTATERPRIPDSTIAHIKDFLDSVRKREQPRFDLELGYTVDIPLCMAMRSHLENKAALFDPDKEQIRMS